jgi:hypothetical protein
MWSAITFFGLFLLFTVTAVAVGWPCNWADLLKLNNACAPAPAPPQQVLVDGMKPADAADVLYRQGNQVSSQMFGLEEKLRRLRWKMTQEGVNALAPWVHGTGDQDDAEAVIARAHNDATSLHRDFGEANIRASQYLKENKIEVAKQEQKEAQRLMDKYSNFCSEDISFKLNTGEYGLLVRLAEMPECQPLPPYGLEGLSTAK